MTTAINIQPAIKTITGKKLIGKHLTMDYTHDKTPDLWKSFMPRKNEIQHTINADLISMRVYDSAYSFREFKPEASFEKWAAAEVSNFENIPSGMETFNLPGGLYAVFDYKGLNTDTRVFDYIYGKWLPTNTEYDLDNRPHFEILGKKYKNNDPESEEEIWVPIKLKK